MSRAITSRLSSTCFAVTLGPKQYHEHQPDRAAPANVAERLVMLAEAAGHRGQQRLAIRAAEKRELFERPRLAGIERASLEIEHDVDRLGRKRNWPLKRRHDVNAST